jgi:hypothetical protein
VQREVYEDTFVGDGVERYAYDDNGRIVGTYIEGTKEFTLKTHWATALKSVTVGGYNATYKFDLVTQTIRLKPAPLAGEQIVVQYIDDNEYRRQLAEAGNQELAAMVAVEGFSGSIDLTNSSFEYGVDFQIGDIVTVQDNSINKYINVRVVNVIEVQDDNGYQTNIEFEAV